MKQKYFQKKRFSKTLYWIVFGRQYNIGRLNFPMKFSGEIINSMRKVPTFQIFHHWNCRRFNLEKSHIVDFFLINIFFIVSKQQTTNTRNPVTFLFSCSFCYIKNLKDLDLFQLFFSWFKHIAERFSIWFF